MQSARTLKWNYLKNEKLNIGKLFDSLYFYWQEEPSKNFPKNCNTSGLLGTMGFDGKLQNQQKIMKPIAILKYHVRSFTAIFIAND